MRKILLVEDDQILSIALRKGLESEGYAVETAGDGPAGRRAAIEKQFDMIILDVMLPNRVASTFASNCAPRATRRRSSC